ncbi:hypothetical protein OPQ81_010760 [Rhizoctonia solani]|nr:hypothetical protein OPQ81_010760 [Rhizoctonia solani]
MPEQVRNGCVRYSFLDHEVYLFMVFRHLSALVALGTLSRAWRADFSEATQCGTVAVTWSATAAESIGPPFVVRMVAFGLAPLTFNLPASAWSDSSRTGSYSFTVPWPEGTQFLSAMDDGFGLGTGGISGIQTVKSSSNSACFNSSITNPSHLFDISSNFAQCSVVNINWTQPATSQTRIAGLVPNGVAFQLDPPLVGTKSTTWDLNIEAGTAFVLIYNNGSGNAIASQLLRSLSSSNTDCLASGAYPSATASQSGVSQGTVMSTPTQSTSATSTPVSGSNNNKHSNLGPILGAVLGALALLAALGFGIWFARRRYRRRVVPQTPESAKEVDLGAENARPSHQVHRHPGTSPQHPGGATILPFILPYNGSHQQENSPSSPTRKRPTRDTPREMVDPSDSSHIYMTGTSASESNPEIQGHVDDEPMIIRHEDAGVIISPPQPREIIELPPGYDQLPRRLPRVPPPEQGRSQPMSPQKSSG